MISSHSASVDTQPLAGQKRVVSAPAMSAWASRSHILPIASGSGSVVNSR